jgi:hypothetical protein
VLVHSSLHSELQRQPDVNLGLNLNNSFCVFTCQRLCQPEALRSWITAVTLLGYAESA